MINPIKFLKTYLYSYEASPITKINQIKQNDLLSLNSQNKKTDFYIIKRTPGAGLFSNFIFVLNHIKIADSLATNLLLIWKIFQQFTMKQNLLKFKNAWNYYFDNKKNYILKEIFKNNKFIITSNRFSKSFFHL